MGQEDTVTGEIKYSYSDFWVELNGLVGGLPETISTESRERLTQLRLLNDVSYQLYENAKQFVSDAGVDKATFQGALQPSRQESPVLIPVPTRRHSGSVIIR